MSIPALGSYHGHPYLPLSDAAPPGPKHVADTPGPMNPDPMPNSTDRAMQTGTANCERSMQ